MRYYVGQTIPLTFQVTQNGIPTTAPSIVFQWKIGTDGTTTDVTPTLATDDAGDPYYTVSIIPDKGGNLYYRWDTDGTLDTVEEGVINIARSVF